MSAKSTKRGATGLRKAAAVAQLRSERELHAIIDTVLRLAKARGIPETEVHVEEVIDALTRFANNAIHQHVAEHGVVVSIRTVLNGRTARVTTNRLDEDAFRSALDDCLSLAASQPKDPLLLPMPGKQKYRNVQRFVPATTSVTAEERARAVKRTCEVAERSGQVAAGIFSTGQSQTLLGNSRGLFASYRQTQAEFSVTMQHGSATSWAKANSADARQFDPLALAITASEKAERAQNPIELAPGRYTVILEPAAVLDLVGFLFYDFSATAVRDKRSCLSGRVGKPLFGRNITLSDDVYHPEQSGLPFDGEGLPRQRVLLVDRGIPKNLVYSQRSAKLAHKKNTGHSFALPNEFGEAPMNLVLAGGNSSVPEMIASTDRGLLVTRLWYIREVDPYEKIMTGMTRDGLFLVEKGKVGSAVRNFRFNQSVLEMLRNVELLGSSHRATAEESFEMVVPPMKIGNFQFSEVTKF
ncbi:MAG: TldD/PmbA family protein [Candidatus Acidiferrum sp.]